MVLLRNQSDTLPISQVKQIAVIGPHVQERIISGGGSAALKPTYVTTPWQGIQNAVPKGVTTVYTVGCYGALACKGYLCSQVNGYHPLAHKYLPTLENNLTTSDGKSGWLCTFYNQDANDPYSQGTIEEKAVIELKAKSPVDILVVYTNTSPIDDGPDDEVAASQPALMRGVRLGGCPKIDPDQAIQEAVDLAAKSDVVIYIGGLTPEWESEGFDRPSLQLPGRQDELITKLSRANPNTVVCIQAGSAVSMPWVDDVNGIIQAWYSGNEAGNALADVLFGKINPSGRLPLTLPVRIEDVPSHLCMRSENGKIHYREDLFPFGLEVSITVKNVGSTTGSEVIQVYVAYPQRHLIHPKLQLKGFAKARDLRPGSSATVTIKLDKYAVSYWDESSHNWVASAGNMGYLLGLAAITLL
ncbi:glycoside hydrolase family protein [Salix suchowensis]|nr:glycoside hydrolase family protein [Salix suchowensis]